jgi:hypothetical protein
MRRDLAQWLAVCLLGFSIAFGSAPHKPLAKTPIFSIQEDPGDGGGGGG